MKRDEKLDEEVAKKLDRWREMKSDMKSLMKK